MKFNPDFDVNVTKAKKKLAGVGKSKRAVTFRRRRSGDRGLR